MVQWPLSTETLTSLDKAKLHEPPNYPLYQRMRSEPSHPISEVACAVSLFLEKTKINYLGNLICLDSSPIKTYPP